MASFGLDWPYPFSWLALGCALYVFLLVWHARRLFGATKPSEAWRLTFLRSICALLLLFLLMRPFVDHFETDPDAVRVVSMIDLSGSMNTKDPHEQNSRIDQVRPFFQLDRSDSWIIQSRARFGSVDRLGFCGEEIFPVRSTSWDRPNEGAPTSIGDALLNILEHKDMDQPSALVLFSDGKNNLGKSPLLAGEKFREMGVPIHVVGVGKLSDYGNLSASFLNPPDHALAKEELTLRAEVRNDFDQDVKTVVRLYKEDEEVHSLPLTLGQAETRSIRFPPLIPEVGGVFTFRVVIDSMEGDLDPSDNMDSQVIQVRPPEFFSAFYISNKINQLYPFLKRSLANDRFQLSSSIRLSEEAFHVRGENIPTDGYPEEADFWMDYDVVLADAGCLGELNSTMVSALKKFVENRGGGLLLLGDPRKCRELLGGLMPAVEAKSSMVRQNLSLSIMPDPLFTETRGVDSWKPFLPGGVPSFLVTKINPAARGVVGLRSNIDRSVMTLQAYGAGKSAYWGSSHDWRRALSSEDQAKEFSLFWQGVVEWLGSGSVERVKVLKTEEFGKSGESNPLQLDVLGGDFQPSVDASVEADISGPDGFSKNVQLYPNGASLGSYAGNFVPTSPGAYQVTYLITFPDGEKLQKLSYLKIRPFGEESKDTRYAEKDLRTLANLTGGTFLPIKDFDDSWKPPLSESLPLITERTKLADIWLVFLLLFLAAGLEWIWRRKGGFR